MEVSVGNAKAYLVNTVTKFKGMAFVTRMAKAGLTGVKKQSLPERRVSQRCRESQVAANPQLDDL